MPERIPEIEAWERALARETYGITEQESADLHATVAALLRTKDLDREEDWATIADCLNSCLRESQLNESSASVPSIKAGIESLLYKANRVAALLAAERERCARLCEARIAELKTYRLARNSYVPAITHELERCATAIREAQPQP